MSAVKEGSLVKLTGSRYFPGAIKSVVVVRRDGWGNAEAVEVDCGHPEGKLYIFSLRDVELVEEKKMDDEQFDQEERDYDFGDMTPEERRAFAKRHASKPVFEHDFDEKMWIEAKNGTL